MQLVDIRGLSSSVYVDLYDLRPVFLSLHVTGGIVGLPVLVLTCFLARDTIAWQPDLINIYISGTVNSISYILLVFAPHWRNPPYALCFLQAAMILGGPPMTAISILLVVIKMHLTFRNPLNFLTMQGRISQRPWAFLFYALPYIVFAILFLTSIGIQLHNKHSVALKNGLYCTVYGNAFRRAIVPAISILSLFTMIVLEILILWRYVLSHRRLATSFPLAGARTISRGIVIRVLIFNSYLAIVIGASVMFITGCIRPWPYMTQAALPLATLLIFGTQKNVLRVWLGVFTRTKKPPVSNSDASVLMQSRNFPTSDSDIDLPPAPSASGEIHPV